MCFELQTSPRCFLRDLCQWNGVVFPSNVGVTVFSINFVKRERYKGEWSLELDRVIERLTDKSLMLGPGYLE